MDIKGSSAALPTIANVSKDRDQFTDVMHYVQTLPLVWVENKNRSKPKYKNDHNQILDGSQ